MSVVFAEMNAVVAADRGFTWSEEETSILLNLWGANDAQSELTGNKRNFVVYEKISEKMSSMGFIRTASQCREKIKRMKREYTLTKQYNSRTDGPKKKMRFYNQFEKILFEKQSKTQKMTVPDTKQERRSKRSNLELSEKSKDNTSKIDSEDFLLLDSKEKEENAWSPSALLVEGEEAPEFENCSPLSVTNSVNAEPPERKKRKMSSKLSFFQCMMESLTLKFMKYQTESDARFLDKIEQLELERTKMDEKIQKMWLDFEERRRTDEKEHELNVMAVFQRIMNQMKNNDIVNV